MGSMIVQITLYKINEGSLLDVTATLPLRVLWFIVTHHHTLILFAKRAN